MYRFIILYGTYLAILYISFHGWRVEYLRKIPKVNLDVSEVIFTDCINMVSSNRSINMTQPFYIQ